ncbi:MAG: T9SS type A sorting domain-containing protein [Saprospiraceae bacterium]|nr:T9SS type A sorting domain-containing protein [Saprospiraceae bacterium]
MNKLLPVIMLSMTTLVNAQSFPWQNPLRIAWSNDGIIFNASTIFQDSAGVPSVIRWKGDTLICAFQWFRLPQNTPTWDRVSVKFSYDAGLSWTSPTPIVVNGLPANYQRPFDPTLTVFAGDSLRIYFSSSDGIPMGGLNQIVNCYSAKSDDGIHYTFEPNARVDHPSKPLIDPAVIYFNGGWHYTAPIGAPQDGAYHQVSPDGLNFSPVPNIPSDNQHNWTGNMMLNHETEMRFYGSGPFIWYNSTANGGVWNGFVNTNIQGGDPSVVQISANSYWMIYVGHPYSTGSNEPDSVLSSAKVFPNPATSIMQILSTEKLTEYEYAIFDINGRLLQEGRTGTNSMSVKGMPNGIYFLKIRVGEKAGFFKFIKN